MRMLHEDYKAQVRTRPRSSFFACTLRKFQASKGLRILITAMCISYVSRSRLY